MQVQKHLFRIAERSNKSPSAEICWAIIFIVCFVATIIFLLLFGFGELYLTKNITMMRDCIAQNKFSLGQDQVILVYDRGEDQIKTVLAEIQENNKKAQEQRKKLEQSKQASKDKQKSQIKQQQLIDIIPNPLFKQSNACFIYKDLNTSLLDKQSGNIHLQIAFNYSMYKSDQNFRQKIKLQNYTFVFKDQPNKLTKVLYGYFTIIARQLILLRDQGLLKVHSILQGNDSKLLKNIYPVKLLFIKSEQVKILFYQGGESQNIIQKLKGLFGVGFLFIISSITTSLYIYITIVASPALILLILKCTPYGRGDQFHQAHQAFLWIGMHSLILKSAQNRQVRRNYDQICIALIYYFIILYVTYYMTIILLSNSFFTLPAQNGVAQTFYGYLAIAQFAALIFMRTRPFIKYFPMVHSLLCVFFLVYCKFSHFGYKLHFSLLIQMAGITLFSWMVMKLEVPAQTTWDPATNLVPSEIEPRAGFNPIFNLNWTNGLPDEWSLLLPMHGKKYFNNKQLTFINRNFDQLNNYLNERHNQ